MTKREIENRIRLYKQQLQLMIEYKDDFLKQMSPSELRELIDETLEKLKSDLTALQNLKKKD